VTAPTEPFRPTATTSPSSDHGTSPPQPADPGASVQTSIVRAPPNVEASSSATAAPTTASAPSEPGPQGGGDYLIAAIFSGAVLAALLTAALNIAFARRKSLEEERARLRTTFAEAFEAVVRYKEMPYAIRRRRDDEPGAERVRLSEEMRQIQAKLSYYSMWTAGESAAVGDAYATLVGQLRRVAGKACHDAWTAESTSADAQMNIGLDVIDLRELSEFETAYVGAAQQHLDAFLKFHRLFGPIRRKHT
jgi:hypothetical protein